jgi:BirA family biotin operon repressor/biotin-[acetyl-CoA-carboxylase] ligase
MGAGNNACSHILAALLNDEGNSVSGSSIAEQISLSRAAVWKHIRKLRKYGFQIESASGKGYRLVKTPDRIMGFHVDTLLQERSMFREKIYCHDTLVSTNSKAYELAERGIEEGTVVSAESQSGGKGRRGRVWISPPGKGLYYSVIFRPRIPVYSLPGLTLCFACSAAAAITRNCGVSIKIKWPNDLYVHGGKAGGILSELKTGPDSMDFLVAGFGLNVNSDIKDLPEGGASLRSECGRIINRPILFSEMLKDLENAYQRFLNEGFAPFRKMSKEYSCLMGEEVKVNTSSGEVIRGKAVDIGADGSLILDTESRLKSVMSGDVERCRRIEK